VKAVVTMGCGIAGLVRAAGSTGVLLMSFTSRVLPEE
jgi:hypothetical protein